jgi:cell division protein FtsB
MYRSTRVPKKTDKAPAPRRRREKSKRPARSRRLVHLLLMLVALLVAVDALVGDRGLLAMLRARKEGEELSATIARERAENARLREDARRLAGDPAAIEEVARRELGLIKPGERVFIVKDIPPTATR